MTRLLSPASVGEALAMLESDPEARPLAGGVAILQHARLGEPLGPTYVGLGHLRELQHVEIEGSNLVIGALTTLAELATSTAVATDAPLLRAAAGSAASAGIRSIATLGGNLVDMPAASDLAAALLALDASIIVGRSAERHSLRLADVLGQAGHWVPPGALVLAVRIPRTAHDSWGFQKLPLLGAADASVATVAVRLAVPGGQVERATAWATAVAELPVRLVRLEAMLDGLALDDYAAVSNHRRLRDALEGDASGAEVHDDRRASAWYRRSVLAELATRAVATAAGHR